VRVVYLPFRAGRATVCALEPDASYRACLFNPTNAEEHQLGTVEPDRDGRWPVPRLPIYLDWVLVLDATEA
jgi:hypothetical protein